MIERACVLADGPRIRARDLPEHVRSRARATPTITGRDLVLAEARAPAAGGFAQEYRPDLLRQHEGNISRAAKTAGVDGETLHRLLAKHRIRP